jgi:hypothetical protein
MEQRITAVEAMNQTRSGLRASYSVSTKTSSAKPGWEAVPSNQGKNDRAKRIKFNPMKNTKDQRDNLIALRPRLRWL